MKKNSFLTASKDDLFLKINWSYPSTSLSTLGCSNGWSSFQGNCYKHFKVKKNWNDARSHCQAEGVRLNICLSYFIKIFYRLIWRQSPVHPKMTLWQNLIKVHIRHGLEGRLHVPIADLSFGPMGLHGAILIGIQENLTIG